MGIITELFAARRESWHDRAVCAQTDPELFFPGKGELSKSKTAKQLCFTCPVRLQCLEWALANDERWGVWGGTTGYERSSLRDKRVRRPGMCGNGHELAVVGCNERGHCRQCRVDSQRRYDRKRRRVRARAS